MTKIEARKEAIRLRKRGMEYNEIHRQLKVSKSSLSLWLRDLKLTKSAERRLDKNQALVHKKAGEASRQRWRRHRETLYGQAQEEVGGIEFTNSTLAYVGAALYWAEGAKNLDMTFVNSDAVMLRLYLRWLYQTLEVPQTDVFCRVHVYLNNGLSLEEVHEYWTNQLNLPLSQFKSAVVNKAPRSSKGKVKNVLVYGTVNMRIAAPIQYAAKLAVILEQMGKTTNFVELAAEFR